MNISGIHLNFEQEEYCDMTPDNKNSDELVLFLLENVDGSRNYIEKYNENNLNACARELIKRGYLRGTIIDSDKCSWSRLTKRGKYLLLLLKKQS